MSVFECKFFIVLYCIVSTILLVVDCGEVPWYCSP